MYFSRGDVFSQKVAKISLREEALWVAKELINAKVCVAASRKENGEMFALSLAAISVRLMLLRGLRR